MQSNESNPVALIGGAGFIGTRLSDRMTRHDISCKTIDIKEGESASPGYARADVRDQTALNEALSGCRCIVNLAAEHRDDVRPESLYQEVNVTGARHICEAARANDIRHIIFTSSVAVYGFADHELGEQAPFAPFNEYGRTKMEAETVFRQWQAQAPHERTLVIVRPTVVFGEDNRGNVYNLLKQLAAGRFVMIGSGNNRKSMAYVENVAAFLEYTLTFSAGMHTYNYVDKPDYDMNTLVAHIRQTLGMNPPPRLHIPYWLGWSSGKCLDAVARVSGRTFPVSAIRIKKFCSNTMFSTAVGETGFKPPVSLEDGLEKTIKKEFSNQS